MENRTLILPVFLWVFTGNLSSNGQSLKPISAGIELQAYPAGLTTGIRADFVFSSHWSGNIRAGYNFARRRDLGENDDERGGGPGFSLGTHYYFRENYERFFIGPQIDFWSMKIDWINNVLSIGIPDMGTTKIKVLQPLVEGGYTFLLGVGDWSLTAKVSLGFEINVKTSGMEVGEGPISLLGVTLNKRLIK